MTEEIPEARIFIGAMDQTKQDDFDRYVNRVRSGLEQSAPTAADPEGQVSAEKQRLAAESLMSREFTGLLRQDLGGEDSCARSCWIRGIIKLDAGVSTEEGKYRGPLVRVYCLPDAVVN